MRILLTLAMISSVAVAQIVTLSTDLEEFLFDIRPEDSTEDVVVLEVSRKQRAFKPWNRQLRSQGQYLGYPRSYDAGITHEEKSDIRFIVTTLADKSLISIAKAKSELEHAGDRIDHVHPFHFLCTIFTDDQLKVGIRNIRGKGWVWHSFTAGLKDTLSTESDIGNLKEGYIIDFAMAVNIDPDKIRHHIISRNWDALIDTLINDIPRKKDGDRYDC